MHAALDRMFVVAKNCVTELFKGTTLAQMVKKVGKPAKK
jgi:hypothetical protein